MARARVLVASPSATGRMPLASGSRVPPWPAFSASKSRRTTATARAELTPTGLSSASQPWIGWPRRLRATVVLGTLVGARVLGFGDVPLDFGPVQDLVDAIGVIEGLVEHEGERRREAERHLAGDEPAQIGRAALQARERLGRMSARERHREHRR